MQYDALRRRWKALDDVISLTKDDLYSSPPYMAESDEEAESEGTQSLSRTSSQVMEKRDGRVRMEWRRKGGGGVSVELR